MNTSNMNTQVMNTNLFTSPVLNTSNMITPVMNTNLMTSPVLNTSNMITPVMNTNLMTSPILNTSNMNTSVLNTNWRNNTIYDDVLNYTKNSTSANEGTPPITVETVVYTVIIAVLFLVIITANSTLIRVLCKFNLCQKPNKILRITIAVVDLCIGVIVSSGFLKYLFNPALKQNKEKWPCRTFGLIGEGLVYANMLCISIFAIERYIYLAYPLKYIHWIRSTVIVMALVFVFSLVTVYSVLTEILIGRVRNIASMSCPIPKVGYIGSLITIMPSVIITTIVTVRFLKLRYDLVNSAPNQSNSSTRKKKNLLSDIGISKETFVKGMKTVFLLSGSLWLSFVPSVLTRVIVNQFFTLDQLENEANIYAFVAMRISTILVSLGTSALNPLIQFGLEGDLRVGALRLIGVRRDFSWQRQHKEAFDITNRKKNRTVLMV